MTDKSGKRRRVVSTKDKKSRENEDYYETGRVKLTKGRRTDKSRKIKNSKNSSRKKRLFPEDESPHSIVKTKSGRKLIRGRRRLKKEEEYGNWFWYRKFNIRKILKISPLYCFIQGGGLIFPLLLFGLGILAILLTPLESLVDKETQWYMYIVADFSIAIGLLVILYWEVYRRNIELIVDGFSFKVTTGVIFKERRTVPITTFLTIHIFQGPIDLMFNTCTCKIYSIVNPNVSFLSKSKKNAYQHNNVIIIKGVPKKSGVRFKDYIAAQVNRLASVSTNAVNAQREIHKSTDFIHKVHQNMDEIERRKRKSSASDRN